MWNMLMPVVFMLAVIKCPKMCILQLSVCCPFSSVRVDNPVSICYFYFTHVKD